MRTENPLGRHGLLPGGRREEEALPAQDADGGFSNMSVIPAMLPGTLVPDLIAILGSIFFVVGDVDK